MSDPRATVPDMQSEQARQRRRERKRLEREEKKMRSRKAQMCAGDELDFLLPRLIAALFTAAGRAARGERATSSRGIWIDGLQGIPRPFQGGKREAGDQCGCHRCHEDENSGGMVGRLHGHEAEDSDAERDANPQ
jgi:hypothetical protein